MRRLSRTHSVQAALLLAGGAVALIAFFALPWQTRSCPPDLVRFDPTCPAAARPFIPGNDIGPWSRAAQELPLDVYLVFETLLLGPSLLGVFAGLLALIQPTGRGLRTASIALGVSGGVAGLASALLIMWTTAFESDGLMHQAAIGFFLALAGYSAVLLGSNWRWRMLVELAETAAAR